MGGIVIALRTALGLSLVASVSGSPAASNSFAGVPDVEVRYHEVSGRTVEEIRASLDRHGRTDPNTGTKVHAWTAWRLRWEVPGGPDGVCQPDKAVVTLDVTVGLPRLVRRDGVPPAVLQQWTRYIAAVTAHEANHVRIADAGRNSVIEAIHRSDCVIGPRAAEDAMAAISRRNEEYDRMTRNGVGEGAHFP